MKKIFIACLMAGALTSCLDDEGNYTYTELNEIKIEGLEDTYKVLNKIDHIVIEPQVTGTILGDDDSQYEYEWHICADGLYHSNHKVISHEKNLDYLADFDLSKQDANYNLYLTVTDKTTGLKAQASASIKPSTSYSKGFIVLGDDESTGDIGLDMIVMPPGRDTTLVSNVIDNSETHWKGADRLLYSGMHYRKQQLWMCCDDGSYSMDLQSLAPVAELNDMALIDTEFKHNMPMKVKDFFPHQGLGGNARNANYTGYMTEDMVVYAMTISATYFTTPCNRTSSTSEKLFKFYPMVFSMGAYSSAYNTFMMLYNTDEQRFMRITMSGIAASYCSTLADLPTDIFYWNQANYDKPRKIVWGGNSVNGSYGSSYA
ncbi:MAG: PKD-like family lipoprotein, partial [Prevotella sp.]